jgi:hypothetical protein
MPAQKRHWLWNSPKHQQMQQNEEVRASVRFPLHLPVKLEMPNHRWVEATTQDISASGFLFRSDYEFPADSRFDFAIQMPAAIMGTPTDVVVHGSARVVRSYKKEPMNFTAVVIDDYAFEAAKSTHGNFKH